MNTDACTLPTVERPLRLAEFDALFTEAVRSVQSDGGRVSMRLTGDNELQGRVRDLAERETECCSFFTFAIAGTDADLTLDISVPAGPGGDPRRPGHASRGAVGVSLRINEVAQAAGMIGRRCATTSDVDSSSSPTAAPVDTGSTTRRPSRRRAPTRPRRTARRPCGRTATSTPDSCVLREDLHRPAPMISLEAWPGVGEEAARDRR